MNVTFKTKALFFMIPILVVVSMIFTYESIRTEKEIIRNEIIKRAETVTTLATKTGELPLLSGNHELMKSTVAFLRTNSEVSSVTLYDSKMATMIHDGPPIENPITGLPPDVPISMSETEDSFNFYAPIFTIRTQEDFEIFQESESARKVRENIGWIRLSFSKSSMRENERRIVVRGLQLALIFASASSAMAYFLISLATRPISQIARVAHGIAHGDFSQEIDIHQQSEIRTLADAFHSMKNTIQRVLRETDGLIQAVQAGKPDTRSNAEAFEGDWRTLIDGVNDLASAFAKSNIELLTAKDAAEAANRAKSDFLSCMSHELRTPLNAILGYAQILKRQENLTETQHQQLEIMRNSGEHLLTLINDILDVGKIETQKMEVEDVPFDLSALLQQVFSLTRINAEEKGLKFQFEATSPLPTFVRGDERKLKQILLNLLSNAVKYTHRGGVTLRVNYGLAGAGLLRCEVVDTGIGIPPDKLEAIFEPFTQFAANRPFRGGTGLGLNITKRLLELMQGRMGVESEFGKGSSFWLELELPAVTSVEDISEKIVVQPNTEQIATPSGASTVKNYTVNGQAENPLVVPSAKEMEGLYELAMLGDMQRITAWVTELEVRENKYHSFADKLRELAGGFRAKAILTLVEQHRGTVK